LVKGPALPVLSPLLGITTLAKVPSVEPAARRIPRPPDAQPGRPAPWADLPATQRRGIGLDAVRDALARNGRTLDLDPPDPRHELSGLDVATTSQLRDSAVLVAAFEEAEEARVVLTRRATTLRRHQGEVSFPGGRLEPGEAPLDAALREAHEEVGLDPQHVTALGWLHPIVTFASGSIIRPYVGAHEGRPTLSAQPDEVDRCFDVSLRELLDDGVFHEERWRRPSPRAVSGDGTFHIYFYEVDGETIWGATARILTELCCLVIGVGQP